MNMSPLRAHPDNLANYSMPKLKSYVSVHCYLISFKFQDAKIFKDLLSILCELYDSFFSVWLNLETLENTHTHNYLISVMVLSNGVAQI